MRDQSGGLLFHTWAEDCRSESCHVRVSDLGCEVGPAQKTVIVPTHSATAKLQISHVWLWNNNAVTLGCDNPSIL